MRDAIRDDLKTQTRRVVKNPDWIGCLSGDCPHSKQTQCDADMIERSPYGKPGDTRFLIEPLHDNGDGFARYRDDDELVISNVTGDPIKWRWARWFLNSIHMPTEAARTFRTLTEVRVEKVQDISNEDAMAEGVEPDIEFTALWGPQPTPHWWAFRKLWDSINAERGYGWGTNPFVWVVTFKVLEQGK